MAENVDDEKDPVFDAIVARKEYGAMTVHFFIVVNELSVMTRVKLLPLVLFLRSEGTKIRRA